MFEYNRNSYVTLKSYNNNEVKEHYASMASKLCPENALPKGSDAKTICKTRKGQSICNNAKVTSKCRCDSKNLCISGYGI